MINSRNTHKHPPFPSFKFSTIHFMPGRSQYTNMSLVNQDQRPRNQNWLLQAGEIEEFPFLESVR